jgi:predicted MPP superfamily phosphohydrolase
MFMFWFFFILIYVVLTYYTLQVFKQLPNGSLWTYIFLFFAASILVFFFYQFQILSVGRVMTKARTYAIGLLLCYFSFVVVIVGVLFIEDIFRVSHAIYSKLFSNTTTSFIPSRRKFISYIGLGMAVLPFGALLYGMYKGRYNYKVLNYVLEFNDLPQDFDGYKITQISDIHAGSLNDFDTISYAVDLINEQQSDVIMFTGDLVNNRADEMEPWMSVFSKLKARDGMFSVLGNHDYGDYFQWPNDASKSANFQNLLKIHESLGFKLLRNEHHFINKGESKLAVVGVENWGRGGFKKAGDLSKASLGLSESDFSILLSHDPSHWEEVVIDDPRKYQLTLSGHTHGMQFGIEIPGWIKWSPVKWRYKYWAGIYKEKNQYINVNRGFGVLGYPGRVGIWPEITVITLKNRQNEA